MLTVPTPGCRATSVSHPSASFGAQRTCMEELCVRSKESSNLVEAFLGRAPQHWNSSCSPAQRCFPWKVQIRMLLLSICNEWYMCVLPERADFTLLFSPWLAFPWVSFLCILVGVRVGVLARSSTARWGWQQPVPVCRAASPVTELEEEAPGDAMGCDILAELWLWGLRRRSYFCSGGVCLSSAFC